MFKLRKVVPLSLLILLLAGGCGLPEDVKTDISAAIQEFETAQVQIDSENKQFDELKLSSDWKFLEPYSKRDHWQENLDDALKELLEAESYKDGIVSILDTNKEVDAMRATDDAVVMRDILDSAKVIAQRPRERAKYLKNVRDTQNEILKTADLQTAEIAQWYDALASEFGQASAKYPERAGSIQDRLGSVKRKYDEADLALKMAKMSIVSDSPDYMTIGDSCTSVKSYHEEFSTLRRDYRIQLGELDASYSILLEDMRVDYEGDIARYFHKYTRVQDGTETKQDWEEVDEELYKKHEKSMGMSIASKPYGYFEDEAIEEAAPVGMAMVGNNRYGEWRNDTYGNRNWHYYPRYGYYGSYYGRGRHYYNHRDFMAWGSVYRGRRPYYGDMGGRSMFGTDSAYSKTRFADSTYAKRGGYGGMGTSSLTRGPSTGTASRAITKTTKTHRTGSTRRSGGFFGFGGK